MNPYPCHCSNGRREVQVGIDDPLCGRAPPAPPGAAPVEPDTVGGMSVGAYVRSLNPRLPRSVQTLQAGGLANAFGNGIVFPYTFIYLHNVRGIGSGVVGLILATNAGVSLVAGPLAGPLVDRLG